ncbi:MAG: hypothetical protein IPM13_04115 [Phycisphaerales bacterium]|nr:hypothetical protein [Phycisphaerales bacterium]
MDERPSTRLQDVPHLLRDRLDALPDRWAAWREAFREDPALLFRTPAFRILLWIVGGLILLFAAQALIRGLTPPGAQGAGERATPWAVLYVACSDPACLHATSTRQARDFKAWPLTCEQCGKRTVYRAAQCATCARWFAVGPGEAAVCPHCARTAPAAKAPEPPKPQRRSDDAEDPWGP